jgi:hypothetical protein
MSSSLTYEARTFLTTCSPVATATTAKMAATWPDGFDPVAAGVIFE